MIGAAGHHFEPFVHLADVTPDAALIGWGGFWFQVQESAGDEAYFLVDDDDLRKVSARRHESIGARSEPYGRAVVEVRDASGRLAGRAESADVNHVWVRGLAPDAAYTYQITVDGRPWAEGQRMDWRPGDGDGPGRLVHRGGRYQFRFRTAPAPDDPVPLTFAVIGDFGCGVRRTDGLGRHQHRVANALERTVDEKDVRLILTTGDNIYLTDESAPDATGDQDDDWYFTFYQPYRYLLDHIPVYPSVGNHDSGEQERSDDRDQLADNFFLEQRFRERAGTERSSLDPGLFYSFRFGRDIAFVALDTTEAADPDVARYYDHPRHVQFLERALPDRGGAAEHSPRWTFPFMHHPPLCAGPKHRGAHALRARLMPLARRAGVRVVLSGHEHNFQHAVHDGIHCVITGAAGKVRPERPACFEEEGTQAWSPEAHFLLVEVDHDEVRLTPVAGCDDGRTPGPARLEGPDGEQVATPIVVPHKPGPG